MKRGYRTGLALAALSVTLTGGYWWWFRSEKLQRGQVASDATAAAPDVHETTDGVSVTVRVTPIQEKSIAEDMIAYGTVIPAPGATQAVSVPFESQVRRVFVSNGQRVAAGESLMDIDLSPDTQLQWQEARNTAETAKQNLYYLQQRFALKLATNDQLLQARQSAEEARLRLDSLARRGVNDKRALRADTAGLINKVVVQEGAIVPAGSPLLELVEQDRVEVRLGVEPEDLSRLLPGQMVTLSRVHRPTTRDISGQIRKITRTVNPTTRLVDIFVTAPSTSDLLLDEYVVGRFTIAATHGLVVPRTAVLPEDAQHVLFIVQGGRARKRTVQVGVENAEEMEVSGAEVHAGDLVAILGNYELQDGMAVTIENVP
jgi:RND family efflux transporter MFP subunit